MEFPGIKDFLDRYSKRATAEKVDPLGYYLPPFNYAIGQILEQAVAATKGLDHKVLAAHLRKNEFKTIVGPISWAADVERARPAVPMIQFRGIVDNNVDQFRQPGKQVVLHPPQFKTGEPITPLDKARK
jgi:branched-chain amino acid transport system substrate-binding protein